ncbi:DUF2911 domain-containing protein [Fodinibius sp. Rm-B-1B1-1]|uniref:DUF2911 domain-containing protein n=1 Tax=Fodinibius alkaliphilus TaxID=3140241 RepID=UPI00315B2FBB
MSIPLYLSENIPFYLFVGLFLFTGCTDPKPQELNSERRKSPIAIAKTSHEPSNTYIKIVYGQPYKNNREIFGELVPYNEVWRTGANEATEITTTNNIIFGGKPLDAGTYSVFTIPKKENMWTVILNSALGQWGAFDYDTSKDVLRVDVPKQTAEKSTEALTIRFSETFEDETNIIMEWDKTKVTIPIEFTN